MQIAMPRHTWIPLACVLTAAAQTASAPQPRLAELVKKPYLELVGMAASLDYPKKAIDDYRKQIATEKKEDIDGLEAEEKALKTGEDDARKQLDEINGSVATADEARAAGRA